MKPPSLSSETVHASCVAIGGAAVLLTGRSGSGKSDLALRLIDRGAMLVSDEYTFLLRSDGRLLASAPASISGKIEVRGVGIVEMKSVRDVPVTLLVDLDEAPERLPRGSRTRVIAGVPVPAIGLSALEPSAPITVEAAAKLFGTT